MRVRSEAKFATAEMHLPSLLSAKKYPFPCWDWDCLNLGGFCLTQIGWLARYAAAAAGARAFGRAGAIIGRWMGGRRGSFRFGRCGSGF